MTPPPLQATRFERLLRQLLDGLFGGLRGSWRRRSLAVLALLVGFYLGQNVTSLWLTQIGKRPVAVLGIVLLIELVVRLRSRWVARSVPLPWLMADNLRIGVVYAVVLEGFKLGS
ncbi:MAG: hypothetical protein RLZZ168_475 [Cyanobacteriota bacterium]|jgi:hypothetical protein|uniref:DUF565 domain-containing protein n=1 Tax=Vulcanococcus sp. TaxID=2856995 RepID=UPI003501114A